MRCEDAQAVVVHVEGAPAALHDANAPAAQHVVGAHAAAGADAADDAAGTSLQELWGVTALTAGLRVPSYEQPARALDHAR